MFKSRPPPAQIYAPEQQPGYGHQPSHGQSHSHSQPQYQPPLPQPVTYAPVTHQPMNQSTNIIVNAAGGGGGGGKKSSRLRPWTTELFGCCEDIGSCMCALWCTPCFLIQLAQKSGECCLLPFFVPEALMALRIKLRAEEGIDGSICNDCVCSSCCPLLVMCQLHREIDNIAKRKPGTEL